MTALELAKKVAALLDAKKAKDVEAIDIHGLTTIGDYLWWLRAAAPPDQSAGRRGGGKTLPAGR